MTTANGERPYKPVVGRSRLVREPRTDVCVLLVMANYIAHHTKKKQILARKEAALQRLIASAASADKLIAAVEEVRDARIRVLSMQRSLICSQGRRRPPIRLDRHQDQANC